MPLARFLAFMLQGFIITAILAVWSCADAQAQSYIDLGLSAFDPGDDWTARVIRDAFPAAAGGGDPAVANQRTIIGHLVGLLSGVVIAVGVLFIIYMTIMEIVRAGETGRPMSKNMSYWAYARVPFAMIMMFPRPDTGVSVGQWLVVQAAMSSIGITRTLYAEAIKGVGPDAVPISMPEIPGTKTIVAALIQNEMCRALINAVTNNRNMVPEPRPVLGGNPATGAHVTWHYAMALGNATGSPVCGTVTLRQPAGAGSNTNLMGVSLDMTPRQRDILAAVVEGTIRPAAERMATTYWDTRQAATLEPLMGVYTGATAEYTARLTAAATEITASLRGALTADAMRANSVNLQRNQDRMSALGWSGAGAYALEFNRLNGATLSVLSGVPVVTAPTYANLGPELSADLAPMMHSVLTWRDMLMTHAQTTDGLDVPGGYSDLFTGATPGEDGAGALERVARALRLNERVLNAFIAATSPSQQMWYNPFAAQVALGHKLMAISLTALGLASLLASTSGTAAVVAANVLTGNVGGVAATAVGSMMMQYLGTPIFYGLMCLLIPGMILAFVLPMLPFGLWFAGVAGWIITVFEAVIAVPLWMFAHLTFRGDGLHGRGFAGYALILNILFRPALMLIGLFMGFVLYGAFAWFLQLAFGVAAGFVLLHGWLVTNLLGVALMMVMFVVAHIVATTQAFRMISLAPHHIVRYAGIEPANRVDMDSVSQQLGTVGTAAALQVMQQGMTQAMQQTRDASRQQAIAGGQAALPAPGMDRGVAAATDITRPEQDRKA